MISQIHIGKLQYDEVADQAMRKSLKITKRKNIKRRYNSYLSDDIVEN